MAQGVDLAYALGLPPAKAIEYFKSKGYKLTWDWWELWQAAQAKAFTVAKAMRMDILQDIREMVQKALDEGITLEQFRKELEPRLRAKGWWGYKFVSYPDGTVEKILEGSPWRLKTIFRTNVQTAYMAGRYKSLMENVDSRPYWQYVAVLDSRTRPAHAALHGKVFRYDDPFWNTHYPPLGFNCRCRVRALSQKEVDAKNLVVETAAGKIKWEDQLVSKKTGELRPVAVYHDTLTGQKIPTDVGWGYNPGQAAFVPEVEKYDPDIRKLYFKDAPYFKFIKDTKLRDAIQADVERASPKARLIIEKYKFSCKYEKVNNITSCYKRKNKTICLNLSDVKEQAGAFIHEFGHHIDNIHSLSQSQEFIQAFKNDANNIISIRIPEIQNRDGKYYTNPSVSGLFDALTNGKIRGSYGHKDTYFTDPEYNRVEVFADLFEVWATDKKAWNEIIERYLYFLSRAFKKIVSQL